MIYISERTKKILFIVFFVIFSVGTGYALYYFFFRSTIQINTPSANQNYSGQLGQAGTRQPGQTSQPSSSTGLPEASSTNQAGTEQPTSQSTDVSLLRDSVTQAVSATTQGKTRFYDPTTGLFYSLNADGTTTQLSDRQFSGVQKVDWGKNSDQAILEYPDGSKIHYDFETQEQTSLPSHWQDFDFSPDDSQMVAESVGLDENNRFLINADPNGNEVTALYNLGNNASLVIPSWSPNNQILGFSRTGEPQPSDGEQILMLGKNHENFKALNVPGQGFQGNWSPQGKQLLYSVYSSDNNYKPEIWISDASGDAIGNNRKRLHLNTWANKCTWQDEQSLICAVPVDLPSGAGYDPDSFSAIPDDIYKINLTTGISKKINTEDQNHAVSNPILSENGTKLVFTDSADGKLYSYTLKK